MNQPGRIVLRRRAAVMLGALAALSCASVDRVGDPTSADSMEVVESSRKTQQQVQAELMAFSDRYFAATLESAKTLESSLQTPESRYTAAAARLVALMVTTDIAASPNPAAALLDMTVFVTLKRIVWEEYWMPEVYGDSGASVLETLRELEDEIWQIAAGVYTPEQLDDLEMLIHTWRSQHPDTSAVDFMRLGELGESREVKNLMDAGRHGGMLAPVREANRNLEEMRLLAERLTFMATRMQLLISLQVEMASAKLAVQPEVQQLLEDSRVFAEVSDRAVTAFAALVADLPHERRAAVDQIMAGLSGERERIFAELSEDGELRPALRDLRQTLEVGREMAQSLDAAAADIDALVARMIAGSPTAPRPFDILEYQATFAELTTTVQEMQTVLASVERILNSGLLADQLDGVLESANRLEDEVVNDIIDRAFMRGVALIVIFFVFLGLYTLVTRRTRPGTAPRDGA